MTQMRKIGWPKLKFPFGMAGRAPKERANSLSSKLSASEEYMD
ncbi:hypothetical protein CIPAW_08G160000 [Carya illinoinensis]|uniref:Uncharacterized protein n=1 Tax=Carya illinoinensis TaxID=32201 RepID=A0A8T1PUN4_CARIL|nr:hypothetical protein CIPAW_08G160000 [Carya illinoinensis]